MPTPEPSPISELPRSGRPPASATPPPSRARTRTRLLVIAGFALVLGLLVWSRVELSRTTTAFEERIATLEAEVTGLESELAGREAVIAAQRTRMGDVRQGLDDVDEQVGALRDLLDAPLPR